MTEAVLQQRSRSKPRVPIVIWQILLGVVLVAALQSFTTAGVLDKFFFSRPSDIATRVAQWVWTGSIWPHLLVTLEEAFLSFAIGVGFGIVVFSFRSFCGRNDLQTEIASDSVLQMHDVIAFRQIRKINVEE